MDEKPGDVDAHRVANEREPSEDQLVHKAEEIVTQELEGVTAGVPARPMTTLVKSETSVTGRESTDHPVTVRGVPAEGVQKHERWSDARLPVMQRQPSDRDIALNQHRLILASRSLL